MKHPSCDEEIASLYQQRKQQVIAPEIHLSALQKSKKSRYTLMQLLSILFLGGVASFSILAVISHFSKQANLQTAPKSPTKLSVVEYQEITPEDKFIAVVIPPLAPKQPYVVPAQSENEVALGANNRPETLIVSLPIDVVTVSVTADIKPPTLSLVPLYQEQPKYSVDAIRAQQSGTVKLAYSISPQGEVLNISTVESSVNRELNISARKALSKWRYRRGIYSEEGYEIIFDFTLK
jgi:protein TonB